MRWIMMFTAVALAAGAFFIVNNLTAKPEKPVQVVVNPDVKPVETATVDVYTAKKDIAIGTMIKQDLLDLQPWPKSLVLPDMIVAQPPHPGDLVRMIARTPFAKGAPLMLNGLANENDPSFLASSLTEGMRLVTMAVDVVSGVGGFVFPGDRVDVLITHDVSSGAGNGSAGSSVAAGSPVKDAKKQITEVLIPNVRVLATNQKNTARGGEPFTIPTNISLEVSAVDAQRIRLAENGNGRLSLVLRSLKDKDGNENPSPPSSVISLSSNKISESAEITVVRGVKSESVEVSKP